MMFYMVVHRLPLSKHESLKQFCLMLAHRLRRWLNMKPSLAQRPLLVFVGIVLDKLHI